MQTPKINAQRLWDDIVTTAQFGGTERGGVSRLTLDEQDVRVRDWLTQQCAALGCTRSVDELGNMFFCRGGRNSGLAPIAMGSHLDTQPNGGRFDGILGVLAGLEVIRTLAEQRAETEAPLMLINWTNEEGSRFPPPMLSSGVYAGVFSRDYALSRRDRQGTSFEEALTLSGYRGPSTMGSIRFGALFELHIEQGPLLEAERIPIGVVQGSQAARWYEVLLEGRSAHTGTTPMHLRHNALLGAARIVEAVNALALRYPPNAVGTVGFVEVKPNSRNVIPGAVRFCVDLRHPVDATLAQMEPQLRAQVHDIAQALELRSRIDTIWDSPAVRFDPSCIAAVREGAAIAGLQTRDLTSGAGHDAVYVARVVPTTMIFVPSTDGLSHNEAEYTSPSECADGAQVLLNAILTYDQALTAGLESKATHS